MRQQLDIVIVSLLLLTFVSFGTGTNWVPPEYNATVWESFAAKKLLNPPKIPSRDPYKQHPSHIHNIAPERHGVCGIVFTNPKFRIQYQTQSFESEIELTTYRNVSGADVHLTHRGECGLCSSLQDLSVYMRVPDLTNPVRRCALKGLVRSGKTMTCIEAIGFTPPCAKIWYYNARNTRKHCLVKCLRDIRVPNAPDPSQPYKLNDCLQCDEDKSGPVFKAVAGRTRRGSGLLSSIPRPPDTIYQVEHWYYNPVHMSSPLMLSDKISELV